MYTPHVACGRQESSIKNKVSERDVLPTRDDEDQSSLNYDCTFVENKSFHLMHITGPNILQPQLLPKIL